MCRPADWLPLVRLEARLNKPLISITRVNVAKLTDEVRRLADAVELHLQLAYGYSVRAPRPLPSDPSAEPASVEYATDEKSAREEIIDDLIAHGIISKPNATSEEED